MAKNYCPKISQKDQLPSNSLFFNLSLFITSSLLSLLSVQLRVVSEIIGCDDRITERSFIIDQPIYIRGQKRLSLMDQLKVTPNTLIDLFIILKASEIDELASTVNNFWFLCDEIKSIAFGFLISKKPLSRIQSSLNILPM